MVHSMVGPCCFSSDMGQRCLASFQDWRRSEMIGPRAVFSIHWKCHSSKASATAGRIGSWKLTPTVGCASDEVSRGGSLALNPTMYS